MLLRKRYLQNEAGALCLSEAGRAWLETLGIDIAASSRTRFAYPCMDWSERKDHLAGTLARALLEHYQRKDWLRADRESRALVVTPRGARELLPMLK
jgi:hypothetical protein